jgi:regulatory protein
LLDALEASGLLSDQRFATGRARVRGAALGNQRVAQELRQRGVDSALIDETLAALPDEHARAVAVWRRKFAHPPADRNEWVKQARFLQSRGFAAGTIRRVLDSPDEESS